MAPQLFADKYLLAVEQAKLEQERERAGLKPPAQYMEAPSGLTLATNSRSPLQRTSTN